MLSPKKVKFRKQQKGKMRGLARRGSTLNFGEYGLQAVECGKVSAKQIEAARIAMTRHVKRGGRIWIRIFPDKPSEPVFVGVYIAHPACHPHCAPAADVVVLL